MSTVHVLALSDIHGNQDKALKILQREHECALVFISGDLTECGAARDARAIVDLFRNAGKTVVAVPGNMDLPEAADWLAEEGLSVHGRARRLGDIGVFGVGGSNPTPVNTPFELEESEIDRILEQGYAELGDAPKKVLLAHPPPFGTRLDKIFLGVHVGSKSVREFILRHDIGLCISGHIHESAGEETLADTLCVNTGAAAVGSYAVIQIDGNGIHIERRHI
jgi:Icc-related predicted phosphoesterase